MDDSDDEDQCALSNNWHFQRSSRRWSRRDLDLLNQSTDGSPARSKIRLRSSSSHDSVLTDNEESLTSHLDDSPASQSRSPHSPTNASPTRASNSSRQNSPFNFMSTSMNSGHISDSDKNSDASSTNAGPKSPSVMKRAASEKIKSAKHNFLRRMESFKNKKHGKKSRMAPEKLNIGAPVLVQTESVQEKIDRLGCVDIVPYVDEPTSPLTSSSPPESGDTSDRVNVKQYSKSVSVNSDSQSTESRFNSGREPRISGTNSLTASPPTSSPYAKHAHSSHDLQGLSSPDSNYPKVVSNGYIDINNSGSQLNYRTGSFSLGTGVDSGVHVDNVTRRYSHRPTTGVADGDDSGDDMSDHRLSLYDNVFDSVCDDPLSAEMLNSCRDTSPSSESCEAGSPAKDMQHELDRILQELMSDISGLNQAMSPKGIVYFSY